MQAHNRSSFRLLLAVACFIAGASGCGQITVRTPVGVESATTVFLVVHGDTSRLALPNDAGGWTEYGYGEWRWYALNDTARTRIPAVLLWPTQGTICRDVHPGTDEPLFPWAQQRWPIEVEAGLARELETSLAARFSARPDEVISNEIRALEFVPVDRPYCITNNSTTTIADWLRELGCETRGWALRARYRVKPGKPAIDAPPIDGP